MWLNVKKSDLSRAVVCALLALMVLTASARQSRADEDGPVAIIQQVKEALAAYSTDERWAGVVNLIGATKAVFIAPEFKSGSLILGLERGTGVVLVRHGETWSDPVFVQLSQASIGFQAGVKESQLMMLILTTEAVKQFLTGVQKLGGTGGFALGDWGVGGAGSGGLSGGLQALTVSLSDGLAFGSALADSEMELRDDLNKEAYGDGFDAKGILTQPGGAYFPGGGLRDDLAKIVKAAWLQ